MLAGLDGQDGLDRLVVYWAGERARQRARMGDGGMMKGARNLLRALPPGADAPWGLPVSARTIQEHCPACQRTAPTASPSCVPSAEQRINPGLYLHTLSLRVRACVPACSPWPPHKPQFDRAAHLHGSTTPGSSCHSDTCHLLV